MVESEICYVAVALRMVLCLISTLLPRGDTSIVWVHGLYYDQRFLLQLHIL